MHTFIFNQKYDYLIIINDTENKINFKQMIAIKIIYHSTLPTLISALVHFYELLKKINFYWSGRRINI